MPKPGMGSSATPGHLDDKIWRPWPWSRTFLALALASNQHEIHTVCVK